MDYQGDSKKSKDSNKSNPPPEKNLEKVITGEVITKKPGIGVRFKTIFFGGDMNTATQYVMAEVLFPALRNLAVEVVSKGMDRLVYGESVHRRRAPTYSSRIQYNNPVLRQDPRQRAILPDQSPRTRWAAGGERRDLDNIIVALKEDADMIIERLIDVVDVYEVVSVADLYELLGLPSSHVDHKWGWTHMSNIGCHQVREGYKITLPPLEEIS